MKFTLVKARIDNGIDELSLTANYIWMPIAFPGDYIQVIALIWEELLHDRIA